MDRSLRDTPPIPQVGSAASHPPGTPDTAIDRAREPAWSELGPQERSSRHAWDRTARQELLAALSSRACLRHAFVLYEVLGPPVALRSEPATWHAERQTHQA